MYEVGKSALELESEQAERLQRKVEEERMRKEQGVAPGPVKRRRKKEDVDEPTDNTEADIDYFPGIEDRPAAKKSRKTTSLQSVLETKEYKMTAADREERMRQRAEEPTPDSMQPETTEGEGETETVVEKKQLERDIEQQQKELKKLERKKKQEEEMTAKQKAMAFQEVITSGKWTDKSQERGKTPKIVSAEKRKKSSGFTSKHVKQEDEEPEEEKEEESEDLPPLPDGFHLLSDDIHCKNIRKAEGFIHYLRAICGQFENIVRKGTNMPANYSKLVQSVYWACRAVGIVSAEDADAEEVFDNIKDKTCRAWMLHLRGITEATSYDLLPAAQKESFITRDSTLDDDMEELIKDEVKGMTSLQETTTRNLIKDLCYHNKMAHRHAMEAAEKLETLSMNVTLPFFLKVAEGTSRALIQLNLPSMQEHMAKAEKVRKQREAEYSNQLEPTIKLAAKLNLVEMNDSWKGTTEGRANRILASFVNRYVYGQMHRSDGKVLSAKVLADKFDLKESTLGKLLTARKFLGGRETMFLKKRRASAEDDDK